MSDRLTIEQRHNNMAAIKGRDTKPEILVRKFLWVGDSGIGSIIHGCRENRILCSGSIAPVFW